MKKTLLLPALSFLTAAQSAAQSCDCGKEFDYIRQYTEANYAGFSSKVTPDRQKEYEQFSSSLREKAGLVQNEPYCYYYISKWLKYFNDQHIQVYPGKKPKPEPETIVLSETEIAELGKKSPEDLEGIYLAQSGQYRVALIKNKNDFREYAMVIISSKVKQWQQGQVKMEFRRPLGGKYEALVYYKDHHVQSETFTFSKGTLLSDAFTEYTKEGISDKTPVPVSLYKEEDANVAAFFKPVDDSTGYLRIKSFDGHFAKKIQSVVDKNLETLTHRPNLIIDLRGNGGGSDYAYKPLLPLLYTQPVKTTGADVYATPGNVAAWQKVLDENRNLPADTKSELTAIIEKMKAAPNTFVSIVDDAVDTMKASYAWPKKVVILVDEACASSTEEFLLAARQSGKVILAGRHTAGVLDYSNVRAVDFSCLNFMLGYSTSRSRRIPNGAIDNTGIDPDLVVPVEGDWLRETKRIFAMDTKQRETDIKYTHAILLGDHAVEQGDFNQAVAAYQNASGIKPAEKQAAEKLATVYYKMKQKREFIDAMAAADYMCDQGKWEEARKLYEHLLDLFPEESLPLEKMLLCEKNIAGKK